MLPSWGLPKGPFWSVGRVLRRSGGSGFTGGSQARLRKAIHLHAHRPDASRPMRSTAPQPKPGPQVQLCPAGADGSGIADRRVTVAARWRLVCLRGWLFWGTATIRTWSPGRPRYELSLTGQANQQRVGRTALRITTYLHLSTSVSPRVSLLSDCVPRSARCPLPAAICPERPVPSTPVAKVWGRRLAGQTGRPPSRPITRPYSRWSAASIATSCGRRRRSGCSRSSGTIPAL